MSPRRKNKKQNAKQEASTIQMNLEYDCILCFKRFSSEIDCNSHFEQHHSTGSDHDYSDFNVASIIKEEMKVLNNLPESENDEVGHTSKKQQNK